MEDWQSFLTKCKPLRANNSKAEKQAEPTINIGSKTNINPLATQDFTQKHPSDFCPTSLEKYSLQHNKGKMCEYAPHQHIPHQHIQANNICINKNLGQIDANLEKKIRKGKILIANRLDLHGLSKEQAFEEVKNFILSNFYAGNRMLLIITGKGDAKKNTGVIRSSFEQFINHPSILHLVLYVTQAQSCDGGKGSFYVYLRKQ